MVLFSCYWGGKSRVESEVVLLIGISHRQSVRFFFPWNDSLMFYPVPFGYNTGDSRHNTTSSLMRYFSPSWCPHQMRSLSPGICVSLESVHSFFLLHLLFHFPSPLILLLFIHSFISLVLIFTYNPLVPEHLHHDLERLPASLFHSIM